MSSIKPRYAIGVDLGGTNVRLGIVDDTGFLHNFSYVNTNGSSAPRVIEEKLLEAIKKLLKTIDFPICGIGMGVAGQIKFGTGEIIFAPNLNWRHDPMAGNIEKALSIPVCVLNDVRAITLAEWLFGSGKGCSDILCVFVGTGIGAGVVSGGHLLTGSTNAFGEVGHMTVDFNGPLCTCGKIGCFQAFAGGKGIAAMASDAILADGESSASQCMLQLGGGKRELVTSQMVFTAAEQGDVMAKKLLEQTEKALVAGFASLVNMYNPQRLILGGGVIDGMPQWIDLIARGVKETALHAATESLEVVPAVLKKNGGVVGAAAAVFMKKESLI